MKKILLAVVLLLGGLLAYNWATTGELSLTAAFTTSAEQEQVRQLESDLRAVMKRFHGAGRAAGLSGVDTTADAAAARREALQIQQELATLRNRLTEDRAKQRAAALAREVDAFVAELR